MQEKFTKKGQKALPLSSDAADNAPDPAARGLSAALGAALGGKDGKAHLPGSKPGAPHRPDLINKAPKPHGGANRTMTPRKGHR